MHHNIETLQLYAKSIVGILDLCDAEASALRKLADIVPAGKPGNVRKSMDLQFVRMIIDSSGWGNPGALAVVNHGLAGAGWAP